MSFMNGSRVLFGFSSVAGIASAGVLFRDLADISQWVLDCDRNDVFETFKNRHKLASVSVGGMALNTFATFAMKQPGAAVRSIPVPAWAGVNGLTLFLLYSGYFNPEIMMRPRNRNAVFVPASDVLNHIKREDTCIVMQMEGEKAPRAFPDLQVLRPHVVRIGTKPDGSQVTMTYCGLTNLGMAYEVPKHADGTEVELVPLSQLENNLVLLDKTTGHIGQQINGVDEHSLLAKIGSTDFQDSKRRPPEALLKAAKLHESEVGEEVPTWRMNVGSFVRTYPEGQVFLNDYKMFKDLKKPVKTIYDTLMDYIFEFSVYRQATCPDPVFPTLENIDPRLPPKEQVWAFNVGDDYVALTEEFVRSGNNGIRNVKVGNEDIVASWDGEAGSLGIWRNPSARPIKKYVDVYGWIGGTEGGTKLERVNTVKNGAFWCVVATFFPKIRVNPES